MIDGAKIEDLIKALTGLFGEDNGEDDKPKAKGKSLTIVSVGKDPKALTKIPKKKQVEEDDQEEE